MDTVYAMPNQPHRLFINVVHACPNACMFCVDFKGDTFFGFDLKHSRVPGVDDVIGAVRAYPHLMHVREVYFCGIGEPLLLYDRVVEAAVQLRSALPANTLLAINTSGTHYLWRRSVDFVRAFDLVQVSLNAENEDKYNRICRPKSPGAFQALMAFLRDLKQFLDQSVSPCRVELSVVDTSEREHLPPSEQHLSELPVPDFDACARIADGFGWRFKVKPLIRECESQEWKSFAASVRPPLVQVGWQRAGAA